MSADGLIESDGIPKEWSGYESDTASDQVWKLIESGLYFEIIKDVYSVKHCETSSSSCRSYN